MGRKRQTCLVVLPNPPLIESSVQLYTPHKADGYGDLCCHGILEASPRGFRSIA